MRNPMITMTVCSGDDPPRVCDVQSVKDRPRCPPSDIHCAACHALRKQWLLQQSQLCIRSVSSESRPVHPWISYETPLTVSAGPLLDITVCNLSYSTERWNNAATIVQFILGTVLCTLVITQLVRYSLQMHRTARKWQLNKYISLLIREGLLYFLVYVRPLASFLPLAEKN